MRHGPLPTCPPLCNKFAGSPGDCVHHGSAGDLQNTRQVPLLDTTFAVSPPKTSRVGVKSPWRRNRGATGCGRVRSPGSAAPVPACGRRGSVPAVGARFPRLLLRTSRCPVGRNRRLLLLTEVPCRSPKETEAAHARSRVPEHGLLRFRTSGSGDSPGGTVCPPGDEDTSDLWQFARIPHSWIFSRDEDRPRADGVIKEVLLPVRISKIKAYVSPPITASQSNTFDELVIMQSLPVIFCFTLTVSIHDFKPYFGSIFGPIFLLD